jgi:hypothetical protein
MRDVLRPRPGTAQVIHVPNVLGHGVRPTAGTELHVRCTRRPVGPRAAKGRLTPCLLMGEWGGEAVVTRRAPFALGLEFG